MVKILLTLYDEFGFIWDNVYYDFVNKCFLFPSKVVVEHNNKKIETIGFSPINSKLYFNDQLFDVFDYLESVTAIEI